MQLKKLKTELGTEDEEIIKRILELNPIGIISLSLLSVTELKQTTNEVTPEMVNNFLEKHKIAREKFDKLPKEEAGKNLFILDGPWSSYGETILADVVKKYDEFLRNIPDCKIPFEGFWLLYYGLPEYRERQRKFYER